MGGNGKKVSSSLAANLRSLFPFDHPAIPLFPNLLAAAKMKVLWPFPVHTSKRAFVGEMEGTDGKGEKGEKMSLSHHKREEEKERLSLSLSPTNLT